VQDPELMVGSRFAEGANGFYAAHLLQHFSGGVEYCAFESASVESRHNKSIVIVRAANLALKRLGDITFAVMALILLAPLFLWIIWRIRKESPGAPIFAQMRWGRGMKRIRVYKFRTMYIDKCDSTGVCQTVANDRRVTGFGAMLRRTNLDELPQLFNVLKGDMSLVGPRCHPIGMLAGGVLYEDLVKNYHQRHSVRPGMTGLAQINGCRGPTNDAESAINRVQYDLAYIRRLSLWLDIKILAATIVKESFGGTGS
jgi:polysaccharide biosynthesis protein PslA